MIKDAEIDLTEHRDFGKHPIILSLNNGRMFSNLSFLVQEQFRQTIYGNIPWNVNIKNFVSYEYDGLIALGNSEQRKNEVSSYFWGSKDNIVCDCCGEKYTKMPWKKDNGLCKDCEVKQNLKVPFTFI